MASAILCAPDCECFSCKCRHWRNHGMSVSIPRDWTARPTVREQEKTAIAEAKASGRQFELADDKYRHF